MERRSVKYANIICEDRKREELGNIKEFAANIKEHGLLHPLVVKELGDGTFQLMAGGRRYAAVGMLGWEDVDVTICPQGTNDLSARTIELIENVFRLNLTWQEETNLKLDIDRLQKETYGEKNSTSPTAKGWSTTDTAKLLGESRQNTNRDIVLAKAMEMIPAAFTKAKTKKDAMQALKDLHKKKKAEEAAMRLATTLTKTPLDFQRKKLVESFMVGDSFEKCAKLTKGGFDLIELDPPYGIDLDKNKDTDPALLLGLREYKEVAVKDYPEFVRKSLQLAWDLLKTDRWLIFWCGSQWIQTIMDTAIEIGFNGKSIPAYWIKPAGQSLNLSRWLASNVETFLYIAKGKPVICKPGRLATFNFNRVNPDHKIHTTEKPIELYEEVLKTFLPQDRECRIAIPFLGSGNTLLAAANLGHSGVGCDLGAHNRDQFVVRVHACKPGEYKSYTQEEKE